jgi:hypothetical protein
MWPADIGEDLKPAGYPDRMTRRDGFAVVRELALALPGATEEPFAELEGR